MGWLFRPNCSRQDIVDDIIRFEETEHGKWETLRHSLRGNVLWTIVRWTNKKTGKVMKVISCHLLQKSENTWGYKSLDEAMGPFYYTCPVSYLKEVPVANQEWRDQVLEHHRRRNLKIQVGDKLTLIDGLKIPSVTVVQMIPGRQLVGRYAGEYYRIKRTDIVAVEHLQAKAV
jgi:hypothetical protein